MRVLFLLFFGASVYAEPAAEFMLANRIVCTGELKFLVIDGGRTQSIDKPRFNEKFKRDEVELIAIGSDAKAPWIRVWPWYGIQSKRYGSPKINGAELTFDSDEKSWFSAVLKLPGGSTQKLECQLQQE